MTTAHPSTAPSFVITSTNDTDRQRWSTVLYKGAPLTGKTHAIGTWTAAGPLLYIQWDPKSETISQFPDVHIIAPKDPFTFREMILPKILDGTLTDAQGSKLDYASVAMDSLSMLGRDMELELMDPRTGDMPNGGWMSFAARLSRMLSQLGTIARSPTVPHPANFLATIHEQEVKKRVRTAQGGFDVVSDGLLPKVSGAVKDVLEGYFDLTLLTCKEEVLAPVAAGHTGPRPTTTRYYCRTVGQEKRQAAGGSFRGVKLPVVLDDGTYPGLCRLAAIDPATGKSVNGDIPTNNQ